MKIMIKLVTEYLLITTVAQGYWPVISGLFEATYVISGKVMSIDLKLWHLLFNFLLL